MNGSMWEPSFAELEAWVTDWVCGILERRASNRRRWCACWWEHPEAVTRLRLLMLSHRQVLDEGDALAMSSWLLDHLDRHLDALQHTDGPFAGCSVDRHSPHAGLTTTPVPGVLLAADRHQRLEVAS